MLDIGCVVPIVTSKRSSSSEMNVKVMEGT